MRIVSLLPSATEIVAVLGLEDSLVGVTHECDYPPSVVRLPKVTRTLIPEKASSGEIDQLVRERLRSDRALYTLDLPALEKLRPDLIVTQALCDVCAVAEEEVREAACGLPGNPSVINLEPMTLSQVLDSIRDVATATGREREAAVVLEELSARIEAVIARSDSLTESPKVAFLEWIDPPFSSGHWTPELVRMAGGIDMLGGEGERSRTVPWEEVIAARPDVLFLACCGFRPERTLLDLPLLQARAGWDELPAVVHDRVYVASGSDYFSRPGPRLVDSLEILAHALHPEIHPLPSGIPPPIRVSAAVSSRR